MQKYAKQCTRALIFSYVDIETKTSLTFELNVLSSSLKEYFEHSFLIAQEKNPVAKRVGKR